MMTTGLNFAQTKNEAQAAYAFALASEGSGEDTAKLIKTLKDGGMSGKDLQLGLEHVLQSGLDGTFEVRDMVRELPSLLPAAQQAGMNGVGGLDYLLSLLQSAANKSGSPAEAATNVQNLLSKTLSPDTIGRLKKMANRMTRRKVSIDRLGCARQAKRRKRSAGVVPPLPMPCWQRISNTKIIRHARLQAIRRRRSRQICLRARF